MTVKASPLQGMKMGNAAAAAIRALTDRHTIDLRVAPGSEAQAAVASALRMDLPEQPGRAVTASGTATAHILCLAPDWWLVTGFPQAAESLAVLRKTTEHHFSAVDVSSQRTTIELEGFKAAEILAHLWEQDLREKSFPVAGVSQGLMAKAPVIVFHVAPDRYQVMVRSSFALHVWKALTDAAAEWL